jgi:hypothetical protein
MILSCAFRQLLGATLLVPAMVLSCDLEEPVADDPTILLHLAIRRDGSEERDAEARQRLDCDPCQTFSALDGTEFLFSQDSKMAIRRSDILSAIIIPSQRQGRAIYLLNLVLKPSGTERIASYIARHPFGMTVNEYRGELLGLIPLSVNGDWYIAGRFASEEDAEKVADSMGLPLRVRELIPAAEKAEQQV